MCLVTTWHRSFNNGDECSRHNLIICFEFNNELTFMKLKISHKNIDFNFDNKLYSFFSVAEKSR